MPLRFAKEMLCPLVSVSLALPSTLRFGDCGNDLMASMPRMIRTAATRPGVMIFFFGRFGTGSGLAMTGLLLGSLFPTILDTDMGWTQLSLLFKC